MFNIAEFLEEQGISYGWSNDNNITFDCPYCGKDKGHFNIAVHKQVFNCFKCQSSGTWVDLVVKLGKVGINEATDMVRGWKQPVFRTLEEREKEGKIELPSGSWWTHAAREYLQGRQISRQEAESWGMYYCAAGRFAGRIIIPICENGKVRAFQGRAVLKTLSPKYLTSTGAHLGELLYPYDEVSDWGEVVLVEGVFDAIRLRQNGVNALCTFGKKITSLQVEKLRKAGVRHVTLMFDADAFNEMADMWRRYSHQFVIYLCPLIQGDPGDLDPPSIWKALDGRFNHPNKAISFRIKGLAAANI